MTLNLITAAGSGLPAGGTTNQVLKKASAADGDAEWADTAALSNATPSRVGDAAAGSSPDAARADHTHAPLMFKMASGLAYQLGAYSNNQLNLSQGKMLVTPIVIPNAVTFHTVAIRLNTTAAGSFVRFGLYADSSGVPGALLYDSGDVSTAGNNVRYEGVYPEDAGWSVAAGLYWMALAQQSSPGASAFYATSAGPFVGLTGVQVPTSTWGIGLPHRAIGAPAPVGPLPSSFPARNTWDGYSSSNLMPLFEVRIR